MAGDRALTPADAAVALRSFPRRFRAVFARPNDADERFDPDEVARRPATDGQSAVDHLASAIALVRAAGETARHRDRSDPDDSSVDSSRPIGGLLDELDESATGAASEVESVPNDAWSTDAIHAVQDAVALVATALRAAGNAIADAR